MTPSGADLLWRDRKQGRGHSRIGEVITRVLDHSGPVVIEIPFEFGHPGYGAFGI
jgi:hypothetical protein